MSVCSVVVGGDGRTCAEESAVKGSLKDDNDGFGDASVVTMTSGKFDGCLIGFSTGIAEKDLLHPRGSAQFGTQSLLSGNAK